ncbi:MAG: reverse transcriptase domain-containing protein [Vampirovibrionales bacterium]
MMTGPPSNHPFTDYLDHLDVNSVAQSLEAHFFDPILGRDKPYTGPDGIAWQHVKPNLLAHVETVRQQLRKGRFTFTPFQRTPLNSLTPPTPNRHGKPMKKKGPDPSPNKVRVVYKPSIRNVTAQTCLLAYLAPRLNSQFSAASYAYQPGKSAHGAVKRLRRSLTADRPCGLVFDIVGFFDHLDHDRLLADAQQLLGTDWDPLLEAMLRRYLKTGSVQRPRKHQPAHGRLNSQHPSRGYQPRHQGVPQGGALSALLSNVALHGLDTYAAGHWYDVTYIRYADNIALLGSSMAQVKACYDDLAHVLDNDYGLAVYGPDEAANSDKFQWVNLAKPTDAHTATPYLTFLGYRIERDSIKIAPANVAAFKLKVRHLCQGWQRRCDPPEKLLEQLGRLIDGPVQAQTGEPMGYGWRHYFSLCSNRGQFRELSAWLARTLQKTLHATKHDTNQDIPYDTTPLTLTLLK